MLSCVWAASKGFEELCLFTGSVKLEYKASVDTRLSLMPYGFLRGHHLVEHELQDKLYNVIFLGYTLDFIEDSETYKVNQS